MPLRREQCSAIRSRPETRLRVLADRCERIALPRPAVVRPDERVHVAGREDDDTGARVSRQRQHRRDGVGGPRQVGFAAGAELPTDEEQHGRCVGQARRPVVDPSGPRQSWSRPRPRATARAAGSAKRATAGDPTRSARAVGRAPQPPHQRWPHLAAGAEHDDVPASSRRQATSAGDGAASRSSSSASLAGASIRTWPVCLIETHVLARTLRCCLSNPHPARRSCRCWGPRRPGNDVRSTKPLPYVGKNCGWLNALSSSAENCSRKRSSVSDVLVEREVHDPGARALAGCPSWRCRVCPVAGSA